MKNILKNRANRLTAALFLYEFAESEIDRIRLGIIIASLAVS